jgi:hypothetical protein
MKMQEKIAKRALGDDADKEALDSDSGTDSDSSVDSDK